MTCPKHPIFQVVPINLVGSARSNADLHCHSSRAMQTWQRCSVGMLPFSAKKQENLGSVSSHPSHTAGTSQEMDHNSH